MGEWVGDRYNKTMDYAQRQARQGYKTEIMKASMRRPNYRVENIAKRIAKALELEENDARYATILKLSKKNSEKVLNKALKEALKRDSRRARFASFRWEVSVQRQKEKLE